MDPQRFDTLTKFFLGTGIHRTLVRLLTGLPLTVTLAPIFRRKRAVHKKARRDHGIARQVRRARIFVERELQGMNGSARPVEMPGTELPLGAHYPELTRVDVKVGLWINSRPPHCLNCLTQPSVSSLREGCDEQTKSVVRSTSLCAKRPCGSHLPTLRLSRTTRLTGKYCMGTAG